VIAHTLTFLSIAMGIIQNARLFIVAFSHSCSPPLFGIARKSQSSVLMRNSSVTSRVIDATIIFSAVKKERSLDLSLLNFASRAIFESGLHAGLNHFVSAAMLIACPSLSLSLSLSFYLSVTTIVTCLLPPLCCPTLLLSLSRYPHLLRSHCRARAS